MQALRENTECNLLASLIQSKLPRSILAKLEEYKKSEDPWAVERLRIELKRYVAAQETGDRLVNLCRKSDSSERTSERKPYPSNDWKKHLNLSNTQLDHLQLMKETIDVTTVIKTTGVINANNLLIFL